MSIQPNLGIQGPSQGPSSSAGQSNFSEQKNSTLHKMLPPELIRKILHQRVLSAWDQARILKVCKLWADPNLSIKPTKPGLQVFGPKVWKEYLGLEIEGEIPPPPKDIVEKAKAFRERLKGKEEAPSCTLVFIPKGLTANQLIELIKKPINGHETKLGNIWPEIVSEYGGKENEESYWFLMSNDVIEGSRDMNYREQKKLVENKTNGECGLPAYLEALAGCALHHVINGEHLLGRERWTFTRCQDQKSIFCRPIVVGGGEGELNVCSDNTFYPDDNFGVVARRKFCASS